MIYNDNNFIKNVLVGIKVTVNYYYIYILYYLPVNKDFWCRIKAFIFKIHILTCKYVLLTFIK